MELSPAESPNEFRFDGAILNNMGSIIKIRNVYLYIEPEDQNNEQIINDKISSEFGYSGVGTNYIYPYNPSLKIGDEISSDIEPLNTITILVSSLESDIFTSAKSDTSDWIPVAAAGQPSFIMALKSGAVTPKLTEQKFTITEDALKNSVDSWKDGYVNVNHSIGGKSNNFKIKDAKYEKGLLYHQFAPETAEFIRNESSSGTSIEIKPLKIKDKQVVELRGKGLSVLYPPSKPACTPEMGCSSLSPSNNQIFQDTQNSIQTIFTKLADKLKSHSPGSNPVEEQTGNVGVLASSRNPNLNVEVNKMDDIERLTSEKIAVEKSRDEALTEIETLKSSLTETESALTEKDTAISDKDILIAEQTEQLKAYQDTEAAAAEKLKDDQWETLKSSIPPGKIHEKEDEANMKQEFMNDPAAFSVKMVSWDREDPRGESGAEFTEDEDSKSGATTGVYTPGKGYEVV